MHPHLNTAIQLAIETSKIQLRHLNRPELIKIIKKNKNEFFTDIDSHCEINIIKEIYRLHPGHKVIGKISGAISGNDKFTWIINAIDGSLNFYKGNPNFTISIAIKNDWYIENAVIYCPISQELFIATYGEGAQLNSRKIKISSSSPVDESLLSGQLINKNTKINTSKCIVNLKNTFQYNMCRRSTGSNSLDLSNIASKRIDGYYNNYINIYDLAAGSLIIRESGGYISDFNGNNNFLNEKNIIAGSPKIYMKLYEIISNSKV